jgi:alkylglycerol monooxygenase
MTHLVPVPFIAVTVFSLIRAEFRADRRQVYFFKPLSTLLVILVAALSFSTPGVKVGYTAGVLVGLILSLGGDVALMFPAGRAFLAGLVLFLLAHVAYAVTFTLFNGFYPGDLASGGVLLALAVVVYRYLEPGLEKMKGPVIVYIAVTCFMVNRAISAFFGTTFTRTQAWLMSAGAFLFWISDLMLAVNRFRRPFKYHRIGLAFYYGGQLLIALSPAFFE